MNLTVPNLSGETSVVGFFSGLPESCALDQKRTSFCDNPAIGQKKRLQCPYRSTGWTHTSKNTP